MSAHIILGDCLDALARLPENLVDAVVTDPPYHLQSISKRFANSPRSEKTERYAAGPFGRHAAGFMGKTWDGGDIAMNPATWAAVLRVMKPGAHLVAFGGTRTHHRIWCAIEDAGFEIRDTLMWVYGQGFPKSHDVGNGWGTALKPAWESICIAQKPGTIEHLCGILARKIMEAVCQLPSLAKDAEKSSPLSQSVFGVDGFGSAQWSVVAECSTPDDLFALTDTWPSASAIPSSLSIALSWLDILGAALSLGSTSTTETKSSLTIDLRTLNSLLSRNTPAVIAEAAICRPGTGSSASLAGRIFSAVAERLRIIQELSARDHATSTAGAGDFRPNWRPIVLARKPLIGTVAENVQRFGTGAVNIDGCRVGPAGGTTRSGQAAYPKNEDGTEDRSEWARTGHEIVRLNVGRWPANVIHDGSDEVIAAFPVAPGQIARSSSSETRKNQNTYGEMRRGAADAEIEPRNDAGSAARFFYCAKASRADRDEGVEGPEKPLLWSAGTQNPGSFQSSGTKKAAKNNHPTVKPTDLMRWLCRLVTPPNGLILDPFMGSGSTGKAALKEGFRFIGMEKEEPYAEIARQRIGDGVKIHRLTKASAA